jgi:cell division transport system permease protein
VKYNIFGYFLSEGFRNVFKNKKSTFSCLGVMCATMLIFGLFFAIGENITNMLKTVEGAQGMQVFVVNGATDQEIADFGEQLKQINGVNKVELITKEDAYNQMKKGLGDKQSIMEGLDPSIFSASYMVTLTNLNMNSQVQNEINQMQNLKKITSSNETIENLANVGRFIRIITGVMLVILVLISVFIISNTIKLTVHARRKEISIMKYVGATNGFIRAPFMIEGIIIGILSGLLSVVLVGVGYNILSTKIMQSYTIQNIGINILKFSDLSSQIILVYLVLGVGIGVLGSSLSMKRYLEV